MLSVKRMWIRSCLLVGLAACWVTGVAADTSVWKVSKGDDYIYLGGTIHLLRVSDYPLPPAFEQAYTDSDRLFFETDLGAMTDPSLQQRMMTQMTYQDGRTLRSVLNEEAYQTLTDFIDEAGLPVPMAMMQTFKPGLLISTITVLEVQKLGFTPQGVDAFYHTRAMGDGKLRGELESLDEQINLLAGMGEGHESEYILYSLQDFENMEQSIEEMVRAWRSADLQALEDQFVSSMQAYSDELYDSMLVRRNNAWLPRIEAMFDQDGTEYVLAGVAHMVGDDGLLAMLQQRGYSIEQVMSEQ